MSDRQTTRSTRRDPGGRRVTPRDLIILRFVAQAQPMDTAQVATLLSMSQQVALRRLRSLRDHQLVQVHVPAMERANLYTITRPGIELLTSKQLIPEGSVHAKRTLGAVNLAHHAPQVDLFSTLTRACARSKRLSLVHYAFEGELRRELGSHRDTLVPDAVATFLTDDAVRVSLAVEIDLGSERPRYFATTKARHYAHLVNVAHPLLGVPCWRVVVLVPTAKRLVQLVTACWEAGVAQDVLFFQVASRMSDRDILYPAAWRTPRVTDDGSQAALVEASPIDTAVQAARDNGLYGGDP